MELLITAAIISYIVYLRYYADLRTEAEKELMLLKPGIELYNTNQLETAQRYFTQKIDERPRWSIAYLYRARCFREMGDQEAALQDLLTGESYDDTVADIHLEIGRILYERHDFERAFTEFDKAVFHSQGREAMPYYWRGLSRQHLGQLTEAQHDQEQATELEQKVREKPLPDPYSSTGPFFDRRLLTNAAFVLVHSVVLLVAIKKSPVIHWPYLMASISAAAIGFAEPRKGWSLAILQALALLVGYHLFTTTPTQSGQRELEAFNLYGSIGLTFVGSFIGSILKRAMQPR